MHVWKCKLIFPPDTLQQKIEITDLTPFLAAENTSALIILACTVCVGVYRAGLQQLLRICSRYGSDFDIKYNAKKSNIMIVRSREDFSLSGSVLKVCNESKYLGHYITDDLSDDRDMYTQCCTLYAQANMLRICEDYTF